MRIPGGLRQGMLRKSFKGMSKDMSGKLQILQFNLGGSFKREDNLKSELKERLEAVECALHKLDSSNARPHDFLMAQREGLKESLKEAEDKSILLNTENSTSISEKSKLLPLKEYELQTKDVGATSAAQITDLERINEDLKDKLARTEAWAEEAESKYKRLEESKTEHQDELENLRATGVTLEKLASLEKHMRDSDLMVEHVEASKEKQNMFYSAVSDMEDVIEDLKSKVSKAESRAGYTEEKLIMVSESAMN